MELNQLETFLAVAEERSFSRAAVRLHRTQPAVSQVIRKLEASVGETLFDRAARDGSLTASGALLRDYALRLLALRRGELADAAQDAVDRLEAAGASEIPLGPLDETAVAQVARDMLGGEPDEALREVLSRADGQYTSGSEPKK